MVGAPDALQNVLPLTLAPPELNERASDLVRTHPDCLWFGHLEARARRVTRTPDWRVAAR